MKVVTNPQQFTPLMEREMVSCFRVVGCYRSIQYKAIIIYGETIDSSSIRIHKKKESTDETIALHYDIDRNKPATNNT